MRLTTLIFITIVTLLIWGALPRPSHAATTYYVSTAGDDSANGSAGAPWLTLQHAVDSVAPGDTILVEIGNYHGVRIENSGTAAAPITLKAIPDSNITTRLSMPGPNNTHQSIIEIESSSGPVSHWIIEGFEVTGAPGWGIDVRGQEGAHNHNITIRNNTVHGNGTDGVRSGIFTAFTDDVIIENNTTYNNSEHGIYTSNSGDRPIIRDNIIHSNYRSGIHMNGDRWFGGDGLISQAIIERNTIYNNGLQGGSAINMDGVTFSTVRNNWLYDNMGSGIAVFRSEGMACSNNNRIINNTVVQATNGRWAFTMTDSAGDGSGCINNKLFNNVLLNQHAWRGSIIIQRSDISGFESNYNVMTGYFSADGENTYIDAIEWQALGFDAVSTMSDVNSTLDNDLRTPVYGSSVVDAGTTLFDAPTDIDGTARPQGGAFDIGAVESSLTHPPACPAEPQHAYNVTFPTLDLYVDASNNSGTEDGSLAFPFRTIQAALNAASAGQTIGVRAGTYNEAIMLNAHIQLYGGYSNSTFTARVPATSTIFGDGTTSVINIQYATVTLDGFQISNGAGFDATWYTYGGGIYAEGSVVTISNNYIHSNIIHDLTNPDYGGGIALQESDAIIEYNWIANNSAQYGAGISAFGSQPSIIRHNTIENNTGVGDHGGGLYLSSANIEVHNNIIRGNETGSGLGYGWGGGAIVFGNGASAEFHSNIFTDNYAPTLGSGLFIDDEATANIYHELLTANRCPSDGGAALYVDGLGPTTGSTITVTNVTIANHSCSTTLGGNALYAGQGSQATVRNSIFWGNGDEVASDASSNINISYSIVGEAVPGTGNLNTNPFFANPQCDFHPVSATARWNGNHWVADSVHSPAVDAGDPADAYVNEVAPNGGRINLGVYGNTAEASMSTSTTTSVQLDAGASAEAHTTPPIIFTVIILLLLTLIIAPAARR